MFSAGTQSTSIAGVIQPNELEHVHHELTDRYDIILSFIGIVLKLDFLQEHQGHVHFVYDDLYIIVCIEFCGPLDVFVVYLILHHEVAVLDYI